MHFLYSHLHTSVLHTSVQLIAWLVALLWCWRMLDAVVHLPRVPNLLQGAFNAVPQAQVTVIVPARNEAADIEQCLRSLLAQDYEHVKVLAVNDRSDDGTGEIMDRLAAESQGRLRVMHVQSLPAGWMGKTHAMALAARHATTEWLLFTDGDIFYAPDAVRRALVMAEQSRTDHLVVMPTLLLHGWGEGMMLGFFQSMTVWVSRPWRIADPKSRRDFIGVGAFNLVRSHVYRAIGGFEALRMEVLEDIRFGFTVKRSGYAQSIAFGRGLVNVHWATGMFGIVGVMTKNMFSVFRFNPVLLFGASFWMMGFCVAPWVGLFVPGLRVQAALTVLSMMLAYRLYAKHTAIPARYVLLYPFGAVMFIFTIFRSMLITLRQGGVVWRGTFYSLSELRRNAGPLD